MSQHCLDNTEGGKLASGHESAVNSTKEAYLVGDYRQKACAIMTLRQVSATGLLLGLCQALPELFLGISGGF